MGNENAQALQARNDQCIINTYGARKLALTRGEGARVWDADGREYLDFFAGIAVCNLGHAHPSVTEAISAQAAKLVHVSNLYYIEPQIELAELLCDNCFADRWFFCNSGAEANEAAIKLVRRYWAQKGTPKPQIVTMKDSFHGRTLAAITATGQPKYHDGFAPMVPGFTYVDFDDAAALEAAITPDVGAVIVEPIQGEGGVRVPHESYLRQVRQICDAKGVLLVFDEVQTGLGRTGTLFAHQDYGVAPDVMCLAKALGNGVPIGALGVTEDAASGFSVGSHASTFGGNPLSCAAAVATMKELTKPNFIETAAAVGEYFVDGLKKLAASRSDIVEVRGKGLMIGVEFKEPVSTLVGAMQTSGVICGPAGPNVLRFVPPLVITNEDVDRVLSILATCLGEQS